MQITAKIQISFERTNLQVYTKFIYTAVCMQTTSITKSNTLTWSFKKPGPQSVNQIFVQILTQILCDENGKLKAGNSYSELKWKAMNENDFFLF